MFLSPVKCALLIVTVISVNLIIFTNVNAETEEIPQWVRQNAGWWAEGLITDQEYISGSAYLWSHDIIPNTKETNPCDKVDKVLDSQITMAGAITVIAEGDTKAGDQHRKYLLEIVTDNNLIIEEMFDDIKSNPELYDSCTKLDLVSAMYDSRSIQTVLAQIEAWNKLQDHLDAMSDS